MMLMKTMTRAGDRVAAHELGGAVHRTEEVAFVLERLAAELGFGLVDLAGGEIGIDRHLLAGIASRLNRARDFGDAARTLVMTTKFTSTRIAKTIRPMT